MPNTRPVGDSTMPYTRPVSLAILYNVHPSVEEQQDFIDCKRWSLATTDDLLTLFLLQARRACAMLEEYMTRMHASKGEQLDKQMMLLMTTLTKIQKLESELDTSKKSLSLLYEDIQGNSPFV